jgi:hypothetical protein
LLQEDAAELIEAGGLQETLRDLAERLRDGGREGVSQRLTRRICRVVGASSPMALTHGEFNAAAEAFYRDHLRKEQMDEALDLWGVQVQNLDSMAAWRLGHYNQALYSVLKGADAAAFITRTRSGLLMEELPVAVLTRLIHLMLLTLDHMKRHTRNPSAKEAPAV